jgi:hypothetical protein
MSVTSFPEELTDILQRREGLKPGSGGHAAGAGRK